MITIQYLPQIIIANSDNIADNLDFILKHFPKPIFPRTISTMKTRGKQIEVFSKKEMLRNYEASNFLDCRVNAFPSYTEYKGIQRYPPNFIFADIDKTSFKSRESFETAISTTLKFIKTKINGQPTVLWTGNGCHIYLPIDGIILEQYEEFSEFERPSQRFLRFAEIRLTNSKSDTSHNPSFKSCMLRIPGSFNSKYKKDNVVRIIQKWSGYRPPINLLLGSFHAYLIDEKMDEIKQKRLEKRYSQHFRQARNKIIWIENLLQTPIEDYRKNAVSLILAPYFINIRNLPYQESFLLIKDWLDRCNSLRDLNDDFDYRIKYSLQNAIRNKRLPMKFETLKKKNEKLYYLVLSVGNRNISEGDKILA